MIALGTNDIPWVAALGLGLLAACAACFWRLTRSAMRRKLRGLTEQMEKLRDQLAAQERKGRQALEEVERLQASLRAAQEEGARLARELDQARREPREVGNPQRSAEADEVRAVLWPTIMGRSPLDAWVKRVEAGVRSRSADAALLAAELHVVAACENGDPDSRVLLGALKEVSRCLVRFLGSAGRSPSQVAEELTVWAEQFNSAARGRYSIQVPRLGGTVDLSYASPRPGAKTVSQVLTWAVRNANGVAEFKAEVA